MREKHPLSGQTVKLKEEFTDHFGQKHTEVHIEDWYENAAGMDFVTAAEEGNPAAQNYVRRLGAKLFMQCGRYEVIYGKTGPWGNLFHISELRAVFNTGNVMLDLDLAIGTKDPAAKGIPKHCTLEYYGGTFPASE